MLLLEMALNFDVKFIFWKIDLFMVGIETHSSLSQSNFSYGTWKCDTDLEKLEDPILGDNSDGFELPAFHLCKC